MKTFPSAFLMAMAVLFSYSTISVAGQCDVINKGTKETLFQAGGKIERLQPNAWMPLNDCTNLKILGGGPVQIRGIVGGIPRKMICEKEGTCSLPSTSKSLVISQTSSYTLLAGARRMDKGVVQKNGVPRGELYSPEAAGAFDFTGLADSPSLFALYESSAKRQVFQTVVNNNKVSIPSSLFKRGTKYTWMAYGPARGEPIASGGFELIPDESASAIAHELAAIEQDNSRGKAERTLDKLSVYYANGLIYELDLLRGAIQGERE